jgi:DNA helicase-2/ATP-dependent DNA helicase PcrA
LRVALNPRDEIALRRVINYPTRHIGEAALDKLENAANTHSSSLFDALKRADTIHGLLPPSAAGCRAFVSIIEASQEALESGTPSSEIARRILQTAGFRDDIFEGSSSNQDAARRWGNVESFLGVLARHDARAQSSGRDALAALIRFLTLNVDGDDEPAERAVTMTTMHGAKGLEYQVVFVAGLEEGLMPHQRSLDGRATDVGGKLANDVEEERRLFYVSITRAKDKLYLCRVKQRALRGKIAPRTPSRFLSDIGEELLEKRDIVASAPPALTETATRGAALLAALQGGGSRR